MAIARVRQATGAGTTSPLAVTITGAAAGNFLVIQIASNRGSSAARTVTGITCTNCTFSQIGAATNGQLGLEIWAAIPTGTSGTAVSITFSGTVASGAVANVTEFSGVVSKTVDATAVGNSGTGTAITTGAYSVPGAGDLILVAEAHLTGTAPSAEPAGYANDETVVVSTTTLCLDPDFKANAASGSQSAAWTIGSAAWASLIVAVRPSVGASPSVFDSSTGTEAVVAGKWLSSKTITIDHTQVSGASNLANFPVLLTIPALNEFKSIANSGRVGNSDGSDIYFTIGGVKCAHEIENYSATTGQLVAWISVPSLSITVDTTISMWYGNVGSTDMQAVYPAKAATWTSASFAAVWHMKDATTTTVADSVAGATATKGSANHPLDTALAGAFNDDGEVFSLGDNLSIAGNLFGITNLATISAWVNYTATGSSGGSEVISLGNALALRVTNADTLGFYHFATSWNSTTTGFPVLNTGWNHIAYVVDLVTNAQAVIINGVSKGSNVYADAYSGTLGPDTLIGVHGQGDPAYSFGGKLDEVRIAQAARTTGWCATEYNNQSTPSLFYSISGILEISVADSATVAESVSAGIVTSGSVSASVSDSPSVAEFVQGTVQTSRSVFDSTSATTETATGSITTQASVFDATAAATESISVVSADLPFAFDASAATTEFITAALATARLVFDGATVLEAVTPQTIDFVSPSDQATSTEAIVNTVQTGAVAADTGTVTEFAAATTSTVQETASDPATVTENVALSSSAILLTANDAASTTESVVGAVQTTRLVFDSSTSLEAVTAAESAVLCSVFDTSSSTESIVAAAQAYVSPNDLASVAEFVAETVTTTSLVSDPATVAENISEAVGTTALVSDLATSVDSPSLVGSAKQLSVFDAATGSESVASTVQSSLSVFDAESTAEVVTEVIGTNEAASDSATATDVVTNIVVLSSNSILPNPATLSIAVLASTLKTTEYPAPAALTLTAGSPSIALRVNPASQALSTSTATSALLTKEHPATSVIALSTATSTLRTTVRPATAALQITAFTSTLGNLAAPATAALAIAGQTSSVAVSDNKRVSPPAGVLSIVTAAPSLRTTIQPGAATETIAGQAVRLKLSIATTTGVVVITGQTSGVSNSFTVRPDADTLTLAAETSTVVVTHNGFVADPKRKTLVSMEPRRLMVATESRNLVVLQSDRTYAVAIENRQLVVPIEVRQSVVSNRRAA